METAQREDVRAVAITLDEIYQDSPVNYYYPKGVIHGLMQKKENRLGQQPTSENQPSRAAV